MLIDETGHKYGLLTVIRHIPRTGWLCRCTCGETVIVSGVVLRRGDKRSCGRRECKNRLRPSRWQLIEETGNVYGRLTVLRQNKDVLGAAHWLCRCSCGNEVSISGHDLRRGRRTSCGRCK